MSELREAAQAVIEQWDTPNWKLVVHTGVLIDRLRAALAQPETAEPVAWMHPGGKVLSEFAMKSIRRDFASFPEVFRAFSIPLYAHPPRDEWRPASEPPDSDRLVIVWVADDRSPSNGGYFCTDCLRPSRANPDARIWASIGVTHWRDVQPPTEGSK